MQLFLIKLFQRGILSSNTYQTCNQKSAKFYYCQKKQNIVRYTMFVINIGRYLASTHTKISEKTMVGCVVTDLISTYSQSFIFTYLQSSILFPLSKLSKNFFTNFKNLTVFRYSQLIDIYIFCSFYSRIKLIQNVKQQNRKQRLVLSAQSMQQFNKQLPNIILTTLYPRSHQINPKCINTYHGRPPQIQQHKSHTQITKITSDHYPIKQRQQRYKLRPNSFILNKIYRTEKSPQKQI
eukprot:TRINITY_DN45541_c0_g1_i2.p1 TRINITY_DN45541_c0_g1~~TRINITY_DN45541_c0_g1_i2.p1  ORF type:complete len:237 (+),score=-17.86 TRINITY_DN45541_c0_g1_i2:243-953(+)